MSGKNTNIKTEYLKIKALKKEMSQQFDANSNVVPYTNLVLKNKADVEAFESLNDNDNIKISGKSKGKGFTGVMKRWGFHGAPETHGTKDRHRSPGSIGAQGQSRVMPGRKMPGRYGGTTATLTTKYLGLDKDSGSVQVKGGVPGGRNSEVVIYLVKPENNEG